MYSKIDSRFWSDEKVAAMSLDARYLMLYLLTTPHRNLFGCYKMPKAYALEDTGIPEKRFLAAWRELERSTMIEYDSATKTVLVNNFLKYNPIEGPKQVTGAISKIADVPKSQLLDKVAQILAMQHDKPYLIPLIKALHNASGSDTLCDTLCDTLSHTLCDTLYDTPCDAESIPNGKGYGIPVTVTDNSISNSINIHDEEDISDTHIACAREEENVTEYLVYSATADSYAHDIEQDIAQEYIRTAWKYHTGRAPNTTNVIDILSTAIFAKMQMAAICEAIRIAARNASGSVTSYAVQCLKDWASRGLHTLSEVYAADIAAQDRG